MVWVSDGREGGEVKKQHYYSFAFSSHEGNQTKIASVYIGYDFKCISIPRIQSAKEGAGVNKDAVMLSCCYLGKMTEEEIKTGITRRSALAGKVGTFFNKR